MSDYLSLPLISEAIVLNVLCDEFEPISSKETNDSLHLLRLKSILSTVLNFADAFSEIFWEIFENCLSEDLSEKEYLNFVVSRGLLLCGKKSYFNLMLVCGFMSEIVYFLIYFFGCFHFAKLTWKCLLEIIKKEFGDLLGKENGYQGLLSYCEIINQRVTNYNGEVTNSGESANDHLFDKPNYLGEEPLIKQFNNLTTIDSEMNKDEDSTLQVNLQNDIGNSGSLARETKSKQMIMESSDLRKADFLYELLTDSLEHFQETIRLIDDSAYDVELNESSLNEFLGLLTDVPGECSYKNSFMCPSSNLSCSSHSECATLKELDEAESEIPMNESENNYCELCEGKEEQFLKNWEIDFLERYPELKHNIKNVNTQNFS